MLHLIGFLTQSSSEVDEMFCRMIFNVLTRNKDDHAKNFSFICREGKWLLAPAYDLTLCGTGYHGEHATSVNNNGNPRLEDLLTVGESICIRKEKGLDIICSVYDNCRNLISGEWGNVLGITPSSKS